MPKKPVDLLVVHAGQLLTMHGAVRAGAEMSDLATVPDGAVAIRRGRIVDVGTTGAIRSLYRAAETLNAKGALVTPGLVDPHTHLVFMGTREQEFEMRLRGASYMEIAQAGGGILSTVERVRAASKADLLREARPRLRRMLEYGTTTAEVKSGYGLTSADEVKMLEVVRDLRGPVDLVPTFLGAHEVPREYKGRREEYVDLVCREMIPAVAKLAKFCDVFCEAGVFTAEESRRILEAGKGQGLAPKLHAEEFENTGGAELAADVRAVSADHLMAISENGIRALKSSGTVAVMLPGTSFFLGGGRYAPARRLIEAGVPVALGSDFNPGSSMTFNLPLIMSIACTQMRMTPAEAWCAATVNAAHACGMGSEVGSIESGKKADLVVWDAADFRFVPYHYGVNLVRNVVKHGRIVL
ncbi:MAG: imidazolonepropionase [Planctomycetes bacterium]|nr:imidazolonepropionase [Planctomycetota bacterium]